LFVALVVVNMQQSFISFQGVGYDSLGTRKKNSKSSRVGTPEKYRH
jgi:hypothetical protein